MLDYKYAVDLKDRCFAGLDFVFEEVDMLGMALTGRRCYFCYTSCSIRPWVEGRQWGELTLIALWFLVNSLC